HRCAPQALPRGGGHRGGHGAAEQERGQRVGADAAIDRRAALGTPVAFEAAFGWSWLAELLEDYGFEAHLVHPLRCKAIASARLKNDKVDAATLAQRPDRRKAIRPS